MVQTRTDIKNDLVQTSIYVVCTRLNMASVHKCYILGVGTNGLPYGNDTWLTHEDVLLIAHWAFHAERMREPYIELQWTQVFTHVT